MKTEAQVPIVLGRLLEQAEAGQRPETRATVGNLLTQYMTVTELAVATRETYEGYIRRTIMPALGGMDLRKMRGPILDTFYARLRPCVDVTCTGRPFIDHSMFPILSVEPGTRRSGWQQRSMFLRRKT